MASFANMLLASIQKEFRLILRDKVGLLLLFLMPVVLVVIIASVQNSTFEMVNNNRMDLLVVKRDTGKLSADFVEQLGKTGMYRIHHATGILEGAVLRDSMKKRDILVALDIPANFSSATRQRAEAAAARTLARMGMGGDTLSAISPAPALRMFFMPVLQESYRKTIDGSLRQSVNIVERRENLYALYHFMDSTGRLAEQESAALEDQSVVEEIPLLRDGRMDIPNATQHNVPAWTIFAMFFVVLSLGGNLVREKLNGSFVRIKTMPVPFYLILLAKQLTYLLVTLFQAALIFSIGIFIFPHIGLPALVLPPDWTGLLLVTLLSGLCAVSYATCVGMFSQTIEQTNGFGAVSVVILAAIGGIMVPSYVMGQNLRILMNLSPLHWCLEAYYGVFLEGEIIKGFGVYVLPLLVIIALFQVLIVVGMKKSKII